MSRKTPYATARDTAAESLRVLDTLQGPAVHLVTWLVTGAGAIAGVIALTSRGTALGADALTVTVWAAVALVVITWAISSLQSRHEGVLHRLRETNARAVESGEKAVQKGREK